MTETMIDLPGAIAKSDDADFLRELMPRISRRPSVLTATATITAMDTIRPPSRSFT